MITGKELYDIIAAVVPMYVSLGLAFASVRWWKIFTPAQCSGINTLAAGIIIPFLSFDFISSNNPYNTDIRIIGADTLQKLVILFALFLWKSFSKNGSLDMVITIFGISTLPNSLIMGVPLLKAMYGDATSNLLTQIVVAQGVIWFTFLQCIYEYRAAKLLIAERYPKTAYSIASVQLDPDVVSLNGHESLETSTEINNNGKLHVVVRNSTSSSMVSRDSFNSVQSPQGLISRASSMSRVASSADLPLHHSRRTGGRTDHNLQILERNTSFASSCGTDSEGKHQIMSYNAKASNEFEVIHEPPESSSDLQQGLESREGNGDKKAQPPASVMTKLIVTMVWRKLIRNPLIYSSLVAIVWALISFRWNIEMPTIVEGSITIFSKAGLGLSMFSLGLFMGLQPKFISCGKSMLMISTASKFLLSPAVMAATSIAVGLRGDVLQASIVQAALPTTVVCFVFSKEYNVHPEIFSTSVIITMAMALPVTILYYALLSLM